MLSTHTGHYRVGYITRSDTKCPQCHRFYCSEGLLDASGNVTGPMPVSTEGMILCPKCTVHLVRLLSKASGKPQSVTELRIYLVMTKKEEEEARRWGDKPGDGFFYVEATKLVIYMLSDDQGKTRWPNIVQHMPTGREFILTCNDPRELPKYRGYPRANDRGMGLERVITLSGDTMKNIHLLSEGGANAFAPVAAAAAAPIATPAATVAAEAPVATVPGVQHVRVAAPPPTVQTAPGAAEVVAAGMTLSPAIIQALQQAVAGGATGTELIDKLNTTGYPDEDDGYGDGNPAPAAVVSPSF